MLVECVLCTSCTCCWFACRPCARSFCQSAVAWWCVSAAPTACHARPVDDACCQSDFGWCVYLYMCQLLLPGQYAATFFLPHINLVLVFFRTTGPIPQLPPTTQFKKEIGTIFIFELSCVRQLGNRVRGPEEHQNQIMQVHRPRSVHPRLLAASPPRLHCPWRRSCCVG